MKMIRKGEYDLVNISLIGHDPITGRTYEQCQDEWDTERARVVKAWEAVRWWNVWRHIKLRWDMMALLSRRGY